mgnify:CR=1 FL=1
MKYVDRIIENDEENILQPEQLSNLILQRELIEAKKLLLIFNEYPNEEKHELGMAIFPYLSLVCMGYEEINGIDDEDLKNIIKNMRTSLKLFSDQKINKATKIINELRSAYFEFVNGDLVNTLDLGVYYINAKPYLNTYQVQLYFSVKYSSKKNLEFHFGKNLMLITENITNFIMKKSKSFDYSDSILKYYYRNYKIKKFKLDNIDFKSEELSKNNIINRSQIILIFMIYCQLNFLRNVLPLFLNKDASLYYRIKYIIYLNVRKILLQFVNIYDNISNHKVVTDILQANKICNELRNNIFHYNVKLEKIKMKRIFENKCRISLKSIIDIFSNELDILVDSDLYEFESYIEEIISIIFVKNNEG